MADSSIGRVDLDLGLDYGTFNKELNGIANKATGLVGGAFTKLGGIIAGAFAVKEIYDFGKEAIGLASDLQEVQNVVDVTFGGMAAEVNNWSKNLIADFGLSELSAKRYSSTMGAMLKSTGLTGTAMKDMSKKLAELSADMSSFYNASGDEAFEKIRSGISGETEPLKQWGINLSVANMEAYALSKGIQKSYEKMNQAEQTLLRYNYLLSVTKDAQGDFARTSDSWANQTRVLSEQWKIFQGTMGAGFINILTPTIRWINLLIAKLQVAAQYFKAFTDMIFGNANEVTGSTAAAAASISGMGTATQDAGKSVKKAGKAVKGSLSGFDQLNLLSQSTADAMADVADSAATAAAGGVDLGKAASGPIDVGIDPAKLSAFKAVLDEIRGAATGAWGAVQNIFGPPFQQAVNAVLPVLLNWKTELGKTFTEIVALGEPLKKWFVTDLIPYWQMGITTAGTVLAGLYDSALLVFSGVRDAAMPVISWFVTDGLPLLTDFSTGAQGVFLSVFDAAKTIFDDLVSGVVNPSLQLVSKIIIDALNSLAGFWANWGTKIVNGLKAAFEGIKKTWTNLWETFLEPFVTNMLDMLTWLWDKHLKGLVDEVLDFVGKLADGALEIYNKFILPLVNFLIDNLGPTFLAIFSFIGDVVGTAVGVIADVLKGLIRALGGVIDFIVSIFTGDWQRAWNGIVDFMGGIGEAIVGIFKGAVNLVIDAINLMIRMINNIAIDVPDWIPGIGGKSLGFNIPTIPKLAQGGLAYGPTLAMVGDNKGAATDPEVVAPLSKLEGMLGGGNAEMLAVQRQMLALMQMMVDRTTVLMLNEIELGRAVQSALAKVNRQAGYTVMEV